MEKTSLAPLWNRTGSRKTGFNAGSNEKERATEPRCELLMPMSLEEMPTRTGRAGLTQAGIPLDRQHVPSKSFAGFILRNLSQVLSYHSVPEPS